MAHARTIKLLKPGTFIDIRGTKVTFTRDDLAGIAAAYDAQSDPAPLVVGHPQVDAPAYGWVGGLALDGDHLVATPSRIAPAFAEAVEAGHYAKVSAQLYAPSHPSNPKPGAWYLQHVGFLGAQAPGVKGLGTVAFSAADDAAATTIIIDEEPPIVADDTISLSEHETQVSGLQAQIDQLQADARARDERDAETAQAAQHAQNVAFAEGLIAAGTLAPAAKAKVITLMDQLDAATVVSFGEGDDAAQETPLAAFRSLFDAAHPVIALGEHAPAAAANAPAGAVVVSFAAPAGYSVAPDQAQLHARARELQAAEPTLSFWDAFTRARAEAAAG